MKKVILKLVLFILLAGIIGYFMGVDIFSCYFWLSVLIFLGVLAFMYLIGSGLKEFFFPSES